MLQKVFMKQVHRCKNKKVSRPTSVQESQKSEEELVQQSADLLAATRKDKKKKKNFDAGGSVL